MAADIIAVNMKQMRKTKQLPLCADPTSLFPYFLFFSNLLCFLDLISACLLSVILSFVSLASTAHVQSRGPSV